MILVEVTQRKTGSGACIHDAWNVPDGLEDGICKQLDTVVLWINGVRDPDPRRDHAVGFESQIDGEQIPETCQQQSRSDQKDKCERNLSDNEYPARSTGCAACRAGPSFLMQNGIHVNPGEMQYRNEANHD